MACRGIAHDDYLRCHQKLRNSSHEILRFFKIMYRYDVSEVLYLPPEFAEKVEHLVGQDTEIEDYCGERWPVTFSYVDGSLAFKKGWQKFYTDHDLEEGNFLVFSYVIGRYFSVQIYTSSACERTKFNYAMPRLDKRSQRNLEILFEDETLERNDAVREYSRDGPVLVVHDSETSDFDSIEQHKTRRRNAKKGVVQTSDFYSIEHSKTRRHCAKKDALSNIPSCSGVKVENFSETELTPQRKPVGQSRRKGDRASNMNREGLPIGRKRDLSDYISTSDDTAPSDDAISPFSGKVKNRSHLAFQKKFPSVLRWKERVPVVRHKVMQEDEAHLERAGYRQARRQEKSHQARR